MTWWWAGYQQGAKAMAEQGGTTVGKTQIGWALEKLQYSPAGGYIPDAVWTGVWSAASAAFAGNASGVVHAVVRNSGWIWNHIEKPILQLRGIPIVYK